jgi:hypothetical protein
MSIAHSHTVISPRVLSPIADSPSLAAAVPPGTVTDQPGKGAKGVSEGIKGTTSGTSDDSSTGKK